MRSSMIFTAGLAGLVGLASAGPLITRDSTFPDDTCGRSDKVKLTAEIKAARKLAQKASSDGAAGTLAGTAYYKAYIASSSSSSPAAAADVVSEYARLAAVLDSDDESVVWEATCDAASAGCQAGAYVEVTSRGLNFCERYFDSGSSGSVIVSTEDTEDACASLDVAAAARSRSAVILRSIAKTAGGSAKDYALGSAASQALARGDFDRSSAPYADPADVLCPAADGEEGACPAEASAANADSLALVAVGVAYSAVCGRAIPIPAAAQGGPVVWN